MKQTRFIWFKRIFPIVWFLCCWSSALVCHILRGQIWSRLCDKLCFSYNCNLVCKFYSLYVRYSWSQKQSLMQETRMRIWNNSWQMGAPDGQRSTEIWCTLIIVDCTSWSSRWTWIRSKHTQSSPSTNRITRTYSPLSRLPTSAPLSSEDTYSPTPLKFTTLNSHRPCLY